ncbi:lipopolysaccharide heptosyltransferase II [Chlorobium ferrooxidans]|uniref:lipopolysaccharide heptosyltransferase II n=1 Tax=Chlorobium ferrooxidans DSM 13031 TaxID=377431 RepID=Q0YSI5_9CHLB|nr:lipopolysaccharide heptosyltransferase II [Chlorobium ferrooxidans]EAT59214.1 Lipopolysaccharide heptosyltransferase II [Chlorobium ferrooxidans DSM 13031]
MNPSIVLLPNWIGDMLLALSLVMRLPESRRSETTLLVPPQMSGLVGELCDLPRIEYLRSSAEERKRTLNAVRNGGFHAFYLIPFSFSSAWFAMKTGVPLRRGLPEEMRRFLLTDPVSEEFSDNKLIHITREYAAILDMPYHPPEEWKGVKVEPGRSHAGSIVYCPGAAYGPAKKWPHFPELAKLHARFNIVVLGMKEDRQSAEEIAGMAPGRVTDLTGRTSLKEVAAIMSVARGVVSNDSGLMHLAGYIGTPVIGLFGSTSPVWTGPLGKQSIVMNYPEPCAPCFQRTCKYHHYRCLANITPEAVAAAMEKLCGLPEQSATQEACH